MASMYFDDLTVQDLQSNKGSSQQFCINLASLLGSAFSEEKHQPMQASADFLGLCHNVGDCHNQQGVTWFEIDFCLRSMATFLMLCNQVPFGLVLLPNFLVA